MLVHSWDTNCGPRSEIMTAGVPKAGDPGGVERLCHSLGGRVGDGDCSRPPGEPVYDGEEMGVALPGWEGSHQVHVDCLEVAVGHWNPVDPGVSVLVHLHPLAGNASACPSRHVTVEAVPNEVARQESYRCQGSGVG